MNILVTGASGLVGSHFAEKAKDTFSLLTTKDTDFDITKKEAVESYFFNYKPQIVIHFAAHTDLDAAETQRDSIAGAVWQINVEGTRHLAEAAQKLGSYFIHISTDHVFSGRADDPGPYSEDRPQETNPKRLSWYGWTKAQAEKIIQSALADFAIIRINKPCRASYSLKLDYARKILAAYDSGKKLRLFNDQNLALTLIDDVSKVIEQLIKQPQNGIFHVASSDLFTPYQLGEYLLKNARGAENAVTSSSIEDFYKKTGLINRYAQYGGLRIEKTQQALGIQFKTWRGILDILIKQGI